MSTSWRGWEERRESRELVSALSTCTSSCLATGSSRCVSHCPLLSRQLTFLLIVVPLRTD